MRSSRGRVGLRSSTITAVTTTSVLLLSSLTPAIADHADRADNFDQYVRQFDHPMGSQIARVEGAADQAAPARPQPTSSAVYGIDVSGWQRDVDWNHWWNEGKRFAYVKATEGTGYQNPYFTQQYDGSYRRGFIRGSYHFALPNKSSGAAQANYFLDNGGGWSRDGKTLPGALDMEYNPYGSTCYGKSQAGMRAWIKDFHDTYHAHTGRWPVIYTSTSWWNRCVGSGHGFQDTVPLWVARYSSSVGTLPSGWSFHTFWQYSNTPIDQNSFNGTYDRLKVLATG